MTEPDTSLHGFWDKPLHDLLERLQTTPAGLTADEARRRLRLYGPNSFVRESRFAGLVDFLRFLANPLVIILLVASAITLALGDTVGGLIIIVMVLFSVLLNFFMEFQARHAVEGRRSPMVCSNRSSKKRAPSACGSGKTRRWVPPDLTMVRRPGSAGAANHVETYRGR